MKRIISIILIILFLHLRLSPYELSYGKFYNNKQMLAGTVIKNNYLQEKLSEINHPVIAGGVVAAGGAIAGFTLAEMTLAITVIGCLFALTVPDLIQKIQYDSYKIKFKETYSQLNQALVMYKSDGGQALRPNPPANCDEGDTHMEIKLQNLFCKYLNCVKKCNWLDTTGCWLVKKGSNGGMKYLKSIPGTPEVSDGRGNAFILPNGSIVSTSWHVHDTPGECPSGAVTLVIDVNGLEYNSPHTLGIDTFLVRMLISKDPVIYPYVTNTYENFNCGDLGPCGSDGCNANGSSNFDKSGIGCAAKVLKGIDYAVK